MALSQLTFRNFTWLDFRTTQKSVSFSGKANDVGYETFKADIVNWIAHPPQIRASGQINAWYPGRLFDVNNKMFFVHNQWSDLVVKEITNPLGTPSLVTRWTLSSHASDDINQVEMGIFNKVSATALDTLTLDDVWENFFKVTDTLKPNELIGKYAKINDTDSGVYYITGNDENTVYIDWLTKTNNSDAGTSLYIHETYPYYRLTNGSAPNFMFINTTTFSLSWGNIVSDWITRTVIHENRMVSILDNWSKYWINISPLNAMFESAFSSDKSIYAQIDIPAKPYDMFNFKGVTYIFTEDWVYTLTWASNASFAFKKISNFYTNERVYPVESQDNLFISTQWQLKTFWPDGIWTIQYNYSLIPDTNAEIFAIKDGVFFNLWHGSNLYGKLHIEEINNKKKVVITNQLTDIAPNDVEEYKWRIFIAFSTYIRRNTWTTNVVIKTNKTDVNRKIRLDKLTIDNSGTHPATIIVSISGTNYTINKNSLGWWIDYPIKKMTDNFQIQVTSADPVTSFTLYYK